MSKTYKQYIQSNEWKEKRNLIISERKSCQKCGSVESLQVHHLTYDNLYDEASRDLILLCRKCHLREHAKMYRLKSDKPKHSGGQPTYVKLFTASLLENKDLSISAAGFLLKLSVNIDWHTGILIHRRSKKPLMCKDFEKLLNISKNTVSNIIKELKEKDLIKREKSKYIVSSKIMCKG